MDSVILYRCRKKTMYNINAFCDDSINGTIFSEFMDYGELNAWVPPKSLKKYGVPEERENSMAETIIDNCFKNYYLASFTITSPLKDRSLLIEYAGEDGFILVYNSDLLFDDIQRACLLEKSILTLVKVKYKTEKYNLLPFIETHRN